MGSSGHSASPVCHFKVTENFQEGIFLLNLVPQNFQFFESPGHVPDFKNECLLPTVFAALEAALPSLHTSLEATKNPRASACRPRLSSHRY